MSNSTLEKDTIAAATSSTNGSKEEEGLAIPKSVVLAILYCASKYGTEALIKSISDISKTNITISDIIRLKEDIKRPEEYFSK